MKSLKAVLLSLIAPDVANNPDSVRKLADRVNKDVRRTLPQDASPLVLSFFSSAFCRSAQTDSRAKVAERAISLAPRGTVNLRTPISSPRSRRKLLHVSPPALLSHRL